ncbi:MAG TPA: LLM class flavin-dependent oxidoreductase [Baekduia sp.]|uniref:LLM class flavin-dependent oxidoreductase n=1 Tax=Baekduia sp. TaxID=2600305 RepID=UPI002D78D4FA|nr:LLM class flavin-dependent oxidoreductase [Baekduia sp.]HET6505716.1 LLM class flavin-dependent oxidoreductase [Baekduia sp.]
MRFSLLYELQLPRPWDGGQAEAERRLIAEALDQLAAADRLGFHAAWIAEHHFLEERSLASAPDVVLSAASQRTTDLALGLAAQPALHHPAHLAATIATLDLVSGGRAHLGAAATATGAERAAFAPATPAADVFATAVSMMVESPYAGDDAFGMPPRDVVPKPLRKPHPPLWSVISKRAEARVAGERGTGVLVLSAVEPEDLAAWASEYDGALNSERCVPVGFAVNATFAAALPLHVHHDEAEAIARGIDGAHFAAYARGHYTTFGEHRPGRTSVWEDFQARRDDVGLARAPIVADGAPLRVRPMGGGLASQRGAIGTPDQVRDLVARFAAAGVDELVFMVQTGRTRHEHVLEALELFAAEVMPAFAEDPTPRLSEGAARRALERRPARRRPPRDYAFAAGDDVAVSAPENSPTPDDRAPESRGAALRRALEARGERAFQAFVARSPDARLARTAGSGPGLRVIFAAMERQFVPEKANGFTGDIQYNLRGEDGDVRSWTVSIDGPRASARPGATGNPRLAITVSVADFIRIAGRDLDPVKAVLTGRLELAGDFTVAMRLGEMFGQPGPF